MNDRPMTHDEAIELAAGYVLQALDPADEAAVRDHLATCEEAHPEYEELGGVVPALLADVPLVDPPAGLRGRIMDAARAEVAARPEPVPAAPPSAPTVFPSAAERDTRRVARTSRLDWALRIAAVVAVVAVGAWGLVLQRQLDSARQFDQAVGKVLDSAALPGAQAVVLTPAEGKQGKGIAAVAPDGTVTMAMRDLPATTGAQVYTTWVIVGKNAPIAVADFTVTDGVASVTTRPAQTPSGAVLAVTLEPNAGNTAPKGPVVAAGTTRGVPAATG